MKSYTRLSTALAITLAFCVAFTVTAAQAAPKKAATTIAKFTVPKSAIRGKGDVFECAQMLRTRSGERVRATCAR
jgi:hypothetical protein